jgi:hypothetical protein
MKSPDTYFATLSRGKTVLWCYLIWYLATLWYHFDPAPGIWINSVGISLIIGIGLLLSVARPAGAPTDHWQTARLFLMPFCVSSFAALIKSKNFLFVFPTNGSELATSLGACAAFIAVVAMLKKGYRRARR